MKHENFIIFSDVKRVFIRYRLVILAGAFLFGGVGFYMRSQIPVTYEVSSTFKEAQPSTNAPGDGLFETMVKSMGMRGDQRGFYIITSSMMLKPVVEKLGMQASISTGNGMRGKIRQVRDALRAERGKATAPKDCFVFENVSYQGEKPRGYQVFFTSKNRFEVRSLKNQVLGKGLVGEPIRFDGVSLTLTKTPSNFELRSIYPLTITSAHSHVLSLREQIEVSAVGGERSVIQLTFFHKDRNFGKKVLDAVMVEYENYLVRENARVSREQIDYLEKRRDEFCTQMDSYLQDHVDYLKESLGDTGYLTLGQRLPFIQDKQKNLSGKLIELDMEGQTLLSSNNGELGGLQRELHVFLKQRDELDLALMGTPTPDKYLEKLDQINLQEMRVKTGVDHFFSGLISGLRHDKKMRDDLSLSLKEFGQVLSPVAHQLSTLQKEKMRVQRLINEKEHAEMTTSYLKNQYRLISMQENILKQRVYHHSALSEEFAGIDMGSLKKLLSDYLQDRDGILSAIRKLEFVKEQMNREGVEWVSLSAALPDGISKEIALEMGHLTQQMRKKGGFTEKELERMEGNFSLKKTNLIKHMDQTIHLEQLQMGLLNERIRLVQSTMVDLLNKDIALVEEQIKDRIADRLMQLDREKEVVGGQIEQVTSELTHVPEMWLKERQLQFSSEMHRGMLESLVRLVESKNIETNLLTVESKPLDFAYAPLTPKHPKLKLITFLGFLVGLVLTFGGCFMWSLYQGVPLSLENLMVRGRKTLGKLSKSGSTEGKDLEVLRKLSLLLKEQKSSPLIVTLVLGESRDFSPHLAELLEKEGRKALVVDLDFSKKIKQKNLPGLLHYLEGETKEPTFRSKPYGAFIPMGGHTPFGDEMLKSNRFYEFIEKMKEQYDVVILSLPKRAKDSLPKNFFSLSDVMIVRLEEESFNDLLPYFDWDDASGKAAFLT